MKLNPWAFGIGFIAVAGFLMFNNFQIPTYFLFEKTNKTNATITDINWTYGIKGRPIQLLTYDYKVGDSIYSDKFKAGRGYNYKKIGNKLLVKYAVNNPKKNKVIGQFKPEFNNRNKNDIGKDKN
ncbi:hypothetical protein KO566_05475 [Flavobacteriaceae bacterium XHP0103]|uniref:hypothetical protein n=1 Tax=Marixanthotalea marina TaxID=2844359 RepID=UPI002989E497|nr:hypothetical protein [Marixanthotalea marina]MBU3821503.1 hypothetical protein [Marixanthotalea marina]